MLTREQWENAAKFCGYIPLATQLLNAEDEVVGIRIQRGKHVKAEDWQPLIDWRDFGPLWVKLLRHPVAYTENDDYRLAKKQYQEAVRNGTEQELMQAGCILAAAIGATMKEESK